MTSRAWKLGLLVAVSAGGLVAAPAVTAGAAPSGAAAAPGPAAVATATADATCQPPASQGRAEDEPAIAAFRGGTWYVRGSITSGPADVCFVFGQPGDQPVMGDWDGDRLPTPGVFRPSTGTWYLSNTPFAQSGADVVVRYGSPGDIAYPGVWNGGKVDTVGVYRPSTRSFYLRTTNTSGTADGTFQFGNRGDQPAPGYGASVGMLTVFRASTGTWYQRNLGTTYNSEQFGSPGDVQLGGPWLNGSTGSGGSLGYNVGVLRPADDTLYLSRGYNYTGGGPLTVTPVVFGNPGDIRLGMEPVCTVYYCYRCTGGQILHCYDR